jgi:hydroxymethylpyrimidine kinase/phosphomethylpyrimidine kinase
VANTKQSKPVVLSIAGLDPSGGAGIVADIKTIASLDCFPAVVITSITFQNTTGVFGATHQTAAVVRSQIEPIVRDFHVAAVKTGMLPTAEVIIEVARAFREYDLPAPVVDPVMRATSGDELIESEALDTLTHELFPLARVVTPNIPEAERLTGLTIRNIDDMRRAATEIKCVGARAVLVKGGHIKSLEQQAGAGAQAIDVLLDDRGELTEFRAEFVDVGDVHGSGCTLSAAIAASLGKGMQLVDAVGEAKRFVTERIRLAEPLGRGARPM